MNFNFFNNILNNTTNLDNTNSFISNFIDELKNNLAKKQSFEIAKNLPLHTILNFAKYDGNFALCFDFSNKKLYYIPKENIIGTKPEPGEVLKINSPGKFYVDYTGIPAKENKIENYLKECTIAT